MYERFTDRARKVMQLANQEAQRLNHDFIGTGHVLVALAKERHGVGGHVLCDCLKLNLADIRRKFEMVAPAGPDMVTMGKLPQTPLLKDTIQFAIEEAENLGHNYVGTEHLLLGLLRVDGGPHVDVLTAIGVNPNDARELVLSILDANKRAAIGVTTVASKQKMKKMGMAFVSEVCDALEIANPNVYGVSVQAEVSTAVVVTILCRATVEQSALIIEAIKNHTPAIECEVDEPVMVVRQ